MKLAAAVVSDAATKLGQSRDIVATALENTSPQGTVSRATASQLLQAGKLIADALPTATEALKSAHTIAFQDLEGTPTAPALSGPELTAALRDAMDGVRAIAQNTIGIAATSPRLDANDVLPVYAKNLADASITLQLYATALTASRHQPRAR